MRAKNSSIIKSRNICYFAVVMQSLYIMQTLNWTNQCPLFMTVRHISEISEDDHPWTMNGEPCARVIWWTLDFPNAFVSPGVNSRGELVSSHGASRRRLGDKLSSISSSKAAGPDEIPNWILKDYAPLLAPPVTSIFNASLQQASVPAVWKKSRRHPCP
jgi:hypothetical protein